MENIIKEFFTCSLKSDFTRFDFDGAFEEFLPALHDNNRDHGLCEFEEYHDYMTFDMGLADEIDVSCLVFSNPYMEITTEELVESVIRKQWERLQEVWIEDEGQDGTHRDLFELEQEVVCRGTLSEAQSIELFDRCIHAEHCNGMILECVNLDELREEVEQERKKFATNIRDFLQ